MLCSVYTTIAGEYDGPGFCTPIGEVVLFCFPQLPSNNNTKDAKISCIPILGSCRESLRTYVYTKYL